MFVTSWFNLFRRNQKYWMLIVRDAPSGGRVNVASLKVAARKAGFREGDLLVSFDEKTDLPRETDLLAHAVTRHKPGGQVRVTVLREGKKIELVLPMQE